jgi:ABC-2 type transport system permease protein
MWKSFGNYMLLSAVYVRTNLNAHLAYRGAFFSEAIAMFINNGAWVLFCVFFFTRFPVLKGWELKDVIALWAVTSAGYGIAYCVMGNAHRHLAIAITEGELDRWLLHPRAVLPHLLLGRSVPSAWGDAVFGYVIYFAFVRPDAGRTVIFMGLTAVVAVVFVGLGIIAGSLSFFLGDATTLSDQWRDTVITFATYPPPLFDGGVKVLLFTLVPAGFVSYIPVEALRTMSGWTVLEAFAGALIVLAAGVGIFYRGLRRYESGNLISMNG